MAEAKIDIDRASSQARLIEANTAAARQRDDAEARKAEIHLRQKAAEGQLEVQKAMLAMMQQLASKQ